MAIVAGSDGAVARLDPARKVSLHDVAVRARLRVVREVGPTLCVDESVDADADGQPDNDEEKC